MKAMMLTGVSSLRENKSPLKLVSIPVPEPDPGEVLIRISICGVCHTELDEIEGRTPPPKFPVIPGHQVVGTIEKTGSGALKFRPGERVGVAWICSACGRCHFCLEGRENLCDNFMATGRDVNGGYAEYMTAPENFVHPIPDFFSDAEAAPLLCAGAIGYRSIQLTRLKDGDLLGLTGFGASAHLVLKMVRHRYPNTQVFVFARKEQERAFAKKLGAVWSGDITDRSPEKLNSIIDTTPAWKPVVEALANLEKGGRLVINAIRKEETDKAYLQQLSYPEHLWMEKEIKSVANVTRRDVVEFLELAADAGIKPHIQVYPLEEANKALLELKEQKIRGAKVLQIT
ncbi:MAG TPA: zinc-dependent alcohol dehydrogenase family protein [Eudoraea sp.]|nr:zinc-dependent alcohol dehydrogenase family protein [Eudoraea sp.]